MISKIISVKQIFLFFRKYSQKNLLVSNRIIQTLFLYSVGSFSSRYQMNIYSDWYDLDLTQIWDIILYFFSILQYISLSRRSLSRVVICYNTFFIYLCRVVAVERITNSSGQSSSRFARWQVLSKERVLSSGLIFCNRYWL